MNLKQAFGRRIRTLRELRGLSQTEFAAQLDRSVDAISLIERGKNWPSIETIERLAKALNSDPAELFDNLRSTDRPSEPDLIGKAQALLKALSRSDLAVAIATIEALHDRRSSH